MVGQMALPNKPIQNLSAFFVGGAVGQSTGMPASQHWKIGVQRLLYVGLQWVSIPWKVAYVINGIR